MRAGGVWAVLGGLVVSGFAVVVACGPRETAPPSVQIGPSRTGGGGGGPPGGGSTGGGIVTLAGNIYEPQGIALGPLDVYWTSTGTYLADAGGPIDAGSIPAGGGPGGLGQTLRGGGGVVTYIVDDLDAPTSLLYFSGALYWSQGSSGAASIASENLDTRATTVTVKGQELPLALTASGSDLLWSSASASGFDVSLLTLTGGAPKSLGTEPGGDSALAVTLENDSVFVAGSVGGLSGAIFSVPLAGGTPRNLWSGGDGPASDVAITPGLLYWTVNAPSGEGEILSMPMSGGLVTTLVSGQSNPAHLVILDDIIYFTTNTASGAVLSVATAGGSLTTLASGLDFPNALTVDDAVYVTTSSAILRVPK